MQGLGVVCNKEEGFAEDDFVVEFLGEVCLNGILPSKLQSLNIKFARYMFLRASSYFGINSGFQCNVKYLSNDPSKDRIEDCAQS